MREMLIDILFWKQIDFYNFSLTPQHIIFLKLLVKLLNIYKIINQALVFNIYAKPRNIQLKRDVLIRNLQFLQKRALQIVLAVIQPIKFQIKYKSNQKLPSYSYKYFLALMSDIDALTKNLTQIVGNLMTMIEKSNAQSLIPTVQTIKKTSEMTYHDFLQKVLKNRSPLPVVAKKQSYRLQEDLQLLYALSSYSQITVKTFQQIANKKRINRTPQSLRSRYNQYLFRIQEKQMKQIVNWIERYGVNGYLTFEQGELRLTQFDSKDKAAQGKRQRPVSLEQQSKKVEKKVTQKIKSVPTNCKQLNEVLRIYSKMVNLPIKDLLQRLDKLSGDLVALDNYIETKDERLLWSSQEDEILRKGGAQLEILRKYRGNGIQIRKRYLGIN